jgi:hypothetical protein
VGDSLPRSFQIVSTSSKEMIGLLSAIPFHNAPRDDGALPLTLLEARIDEWIEAEQAKK